jgi:hypothetical protein
MTPEFSTPIRARFTPLPEEFAAFFRRTRAMVRSLRSRNPTPVPAEPKWIASLLVLSLLAILGSSLYLGLTWHFLWFLATFGASVLLLSVLANWLAWNARRRARGMFARDPRMGLETTVEADERSFRFFSDRVRYELGWEAVVGVYPADDTLFVLDTDWLTYVIPRRAFGPAELADQFVDFVEARAGAARARDA